jgi:signal transduction histidine kinase
VIAEFDVRFRAAPMRLKRIVAPGPGIPSPDTFCFLVDKKGRCWYRDRNRAVHVLQLSPKPRLLRTFSSVHPDIRAMYEARDGAVWVAGYSGGIFVNDAPDPLSGEFRRLEEPREVSVRAFHHDRRGRMWIGTLEGLLLLKENGLEKFGVQSGLPNERIGSLAESSTGGLWIGSQLGMGYASGDPVFISGRGEITDSPVGACGVLPDGVLWAGTSFGLFLYDETRAAREMQPSRVRLRRFTVNGQETDYVENMSLDHDRNNCRIDFAAVRLRKAAEILYEHRLVNVDSGWSAPSPQRSVHFAALSPGEYTLQIRAAGGDRSSSSEILELRFAVMRPYWLSWWFYAILLAVVASVVAVGIRVKIARLLENERIRTRIAADLHDDIGAGLTHIGMMSDMMEQQARGLVNRRPDVSPEIDALRTSISRTGRIARELVDGMSDVVWSLDPRNDSMAQLADRLRVFAYEITEPLDITMDFHFVAPAGRLHTRSEITRCLLLVVREALNNLVRHSNATVAAVGIEAEGKDVIFSITDNGRGFDEETLARKSGITHMRNRVKACGGKLEVISAPGNGTQIRGSVPLEV